MTVDASTIHPTPAGKSILVICCGEVCLHREMERCFARCRTPVERPDRRTIVDPNRGTIQFMLECRMETDIFKEKWDEIHTCGCVWTSGGISNVLRSRLTDPASWPGYFSKFP